MFKSNFLGIVLLIDSQEMSQTKFEVRGIATQAQNIRAYAPAAVTVVLAHATMLKAGCRESLHSVHKLCWPLRDKRVL